jgi:hypothetical protein
MATHAVDQYELAHCPADRLNRLFLDAAFGIQQRDMRGEFLLRQISPALARHRNAKRSSERFQPVQPVVPSEDERLIAGFASKGDRPIEQNLERWRPYFCGILTCDPGDRLRQLTEKEQRDV